MAPLAGKPPFATEEPDSLYDSSPATRRASPPKPDNPNKRSSAYDVYDNYLAVGGTQTTPNSLRPTSAISTATSRNSGIGALGMGLLGMDCDGDDDSDDEEAYERRRKAEKERREQEEQEEAGGQSKNAALAAAIANGRKTPCSPSTPDLAVPARSSPPPTQRSPPPIAAPRPGYAAQISALDSGFGKSPSPVENPFEPERQYPHLPLPLHLRSPPGLGGYQNSVCAGPPPRGPPGVNMNLMPQPPNNNNNRGGPPMPPPNALVRGMTPAPLAAPITPIMPVFAVGPKSATSLSSSLSSSSCEGDGGGKEGGIRWDDLPVPTPRKPIMRSNTEDALLPSRGEKGDDFWRRFSMIAKVEKKESSWLSKMKRGGNRLSWWVWVVGIGLLVVIGAGVGLGLYLTRGSSANQQPETFGGGGTGSMVMSSSSVAVGGATSATMTVLHVSPTHTIAARAEESVRFVVR